MADLDPLAALISPSASVEEAAAIVAAVERFRRETAPRQAPAGTRPDCWRRAAILEGVSREPHEGAADPWINT
jgi:hypothetical protein